MIPRSALNMILIVLALGLVRYSIWFYFDTKVEDLELWSILGIGVTFGILYQIASESTKSWFISVAQKALYSPVTTKASSIAAIIIAFALLLISHIDVSWGGIRNIDLFVDGKRIEEEISKNDDNRYSVRLYGISFFSKTINANVFENTARLLPFTKQTIRIPAHAIMKENENIQEIEKQLLMAFFQLFEARYIEEAKKLLGALKNANTEQEEMLSRLDSIRQLIDLSIVGPDVSGSAATLLERYEAVYTDDPWLPLIRAAYHYGRKEYLAGYDALSSFEEKSKYPKESASFFFQGVLKLRIARESKENEKNNTINEAIALFKQAESELESEPKGIYRNLALSSALYFQGVAEFYRRNLIAARELFDKTAKVAEGDILARAWNGFGYISFILGDLEEAELALLDALDASPTFAYARSNYGYVLLAQNKLDQAISLFEQNLNDEKLKKESYRDIVLAKLAIAHANELKKDDTEKSVANYSIILNELKLRDFVGIDPPTLRLAYIHNEIGEKVYIDKHYYGLEIFALCYFAKSGLLSIELEANYPGDKRVERIKERSIRNFTDLQGIVDTSWFSKGEETGLFSPIMNFTNKLPNE